MPISPGTVKNSIITEYPKIQYNRGDINFMINKTQMKKSIDDRIH